MGIRNFRNFRNETFRFAEGVNTIVGENGSGKSNALYALRLLIDDRLAYRSQRLRSTDFCRALPSWKGHWIIVSIGFEDLDPSEGCQILRHQVGHMGGTQSGALTYFFRPCIEIRRELHELTVDGADQAAVQAYRETITDDRYEAVLSGRAAADFCDDDVYESVVGVFETGTFPDPDDDDAAVLGVRVSPIHREITCTFVEALRDVVADLRGYRNNPLLDLLRGTESTISDADATAIGDAVTGLNTQIAGLSEIRDIASGVRSTLRRTVGGTYSPTIDIESSLPANIDQLMRRLVLRVGDTIGADYRGDVAEQGLGAANLIFLSLRLLEFELKLAGDRAAHFLLIEEPEAHLHTHIQKTLFEKYSDSATQVFVTTHSSHLSSASQVSRMNVLARAGGDHASVYVPSNGLDADECSRLERYLDAVRSTLLFAKGVVLVEGDAELILIPALVKECFGVSLDELGISLVSMSSAFFDHVAVLFHPDRVRRNCSVLTDLDTSLLDLPADKEDDTPKQESSRRSQKIGASRQARLTALSDDNEHLAAFFAHHTFEVEFFRDNQDAVRGLIPVAFASQARRQTSEERLASDQASVYGAEVLSLATAIGKGWAALLLSELIGPDATIPEYIVRALEFATRQSLSESALWSIARYRCAALDRPITPDEEQGDIADFLDTFATEFPGDSFSLFVTVE
ncbi:MAG: AAA family ATPase [Planctomycetota bacterium]